MGFGALAHNGIVTISSASAVIGAVNITIVSTVAVIIIIVNYCSSLLARQRQRMLASIAGVQLCASWHLLSLCLL
jgi:hypothetical protein